MGIRTASDYVDFFVNLNMGDGVSLLSFLNNERRVLKQKLDCKTLEKGPIINGIGILEGLIMETNEAGEDAVLEKYRR